MLSCYNYVRNRNLKRIFEGQSCDEKPTSTCLDSMYLLMKTQLGKQTLKNISIQNTHFQVSIFHQFTYAFFKLD